MSITLSGRLRLSLPAFIFMFLFQAAAACAESAPDLTIFFSSDTRGMLRRCGCFEAQSGGVSARAYYIKKNYVPGKTLVLDAGDTLFEGLDEPAGLRDFYALKAATLIKSMNAAGYDAAAVGEYDLRFGIDFLLEAAGDAEFPVLASNVAIRKGDGVERPFADVSLKDMGWYKAGIVGVMDGGFPYADFPESFSGMTVTDPAQAVKAAAAKLAGKAQLLIVLAHLGIEDAEAFAAKVPEADIVIQGHSQEKLGEPRIVGNTLIVKGFYKARQIGRLDLWFCAGEGTKTGAKKFTNFKYQVIELDRSVDPDQKVEKIIGGYRRELRKKDFIPDVPDPEGGGTFAGPDGCRQCHPAQHENWAGTKHAKAFDSLTKTGDQYDPECLPCHVTGYGFASGYKNDRKRLRDVTCEDCHGRGAGHVAARKSGDAAKVSADTMKRAVPEEICLPCHNEDNSPNFQYGPYLEKGGAHRSAPGKD